DWEAAGGDDERQSLFRRAHERASRWRKRWQRASARCGCYHQERNKYHQRADAAEQRAMEERARAEAAESREQDLVLKNGKLEEALIAANEDAERLAGATDKAGAQCSWLLSELQEIGKVADVIEGAEHVRTVCNQALRAHEERKKGQPKVEEMKSG
ncbi:MAG TPA: hypothetical protein VM537_24490, partial [Anaerolineae bacterium]|nr:hypothetical protein [Anaerolineae bacterium]